MIEATVTIYAVNLPDLWAISKAVLSSITRRSLGTTKIIEITDSRKRKSAKSKVGVHGGDFDMGAIAVPGIPHRSVSGSEEFILEGITPVAKTANGT